MSARRPPQRRPPKRGRPVWHTISAVATTAALAYGAYRAYDYYHDSYWRGKNDHKDDEEEETDDTTNTHNNNTNTTTQNDSDANQNNNDVTSKNKTKTKKQSKKSQSNQEIVPNAGRQGWMSSLVSSIFLDSDNESKNNNNNNNHKRPDTRTSRRQGQQLVWHCRQETVQAWMACWPAVKQVIDDATNTSGLTKELKELRAQAKSQSKSSSSRENDCPPSTTTTNERRQAELWEEIKIETFTKLVTTVYASSLLVLSLTIQFHWVSGQVFQNTMTRPLQKNTVKDDNNKEGSDEDPAATTLATKRVVMENHDYFVKQGLPILLAAVRRAVGTATEEWKPTTHLTIQEVQNALKRVDAYLDRGYSPPPASSLPKASQQSSTFKSRNWIRLLLSDTITMIGNEDTCGNQGKDDIHTTTLLTTMSESLWDLAESPAWQDAQIQVLNTTQEYLLEYGWGKAFVLPTPTTHTSNDSGSKPTKLTLAQLLAPIKNSCQWVDESSSFGGPKNSPQQNGLWRRLQKLPTLLELGDVSFQA